MMDEERYEVEKQIAKAIDIEDSDPWTEEVCLQIVARLPTSHLEEEFQSDEFDTSIDEWMSAVTNELIERHLKLSDSHSETPDPKNG